jgi:2-phosphosulfolactate phosphatase
MQIHRINLESHIHEQDTSVVIDVLRAFTTSAYAFAAGAREIFPVSMVEDAFSLRQELGNGILMGEVNGVPIDGFDVGNSPSALLKLDLSNERIILRTSAGTQGIVRSVNSRNILAASLCCASATVRAIREINPGSITFVETGRFKDGWGDEDSACTDFLLGHLLGSHINQNLIIQRVRDSKSGKRFLDPNDSIFPYDDLEMAVQVDQFDFAMEVSKAAGQLVLRQRH